MIKPIAQLMIGCAALAVPFAAVMAASAPLTQNAPIEISSDKLDVLQAEHKAIFTGNVIAVQKDTTMRAAEMVVFYREEDVASKAKAKSNPQGIYRIEAQGNVVFTTPDKTALGDRGIYNVDADTIDLFGSSVTLTQGANILKGTKLNYNMTSGRSVLTGGSGTTAAGKPARVHGLFVPKASNKPAAKP